MKTQRHEWHPSLPHWDKNTWKYHICLAVNRADSDCYTLHRCHIEKLKLQLPHEIFPEATVNIGRYKYLAHISVRSKTKIRPRLFIL